MPRIAKKMLSWILALALLLSAVAPGGMTVTAHAETITEDTQHNAPTEGDSSDTENDNEPAPDTATVTFTAENGVITNNAGVPMAETIAVVPGKAIAFMVSPTTAYGTISVTANGVPVTVNAQG